MRFKNELGWNEDPPDHFEIESIQKYSNFKVVRAWYKSWGDGDSKPYHRTNGPARMWQDGFKEYWLNGIYYKNIKSDDEWIIKQIIE